MKKSDWTPVKKLPTEMTDKGKKLAFSHHVLVSDGYTRWVAYYYFPSREWHLAHGTLTKEMERRKPTHWMPLPKNP